MSVTFHLTHFLRHFKLMISSSLLVLGSAATLRHSPNLGGIFLNFELTPAGGCQQEVKLNDKILFAFDASIDALNSFLTLTGPNTAAEAFTTAYTVTDGQIGKPGPCTAPAKTRIEFTLCTSNRIKLTTKCTLSVPVPRPQLSMSCPFILSNVDNR